MSTSNTGFNISGYPTALVNRVNKINKLQYDHYLMSYAVTNSGLSAFNKNYKVPVHALREDFKSYIGFENAKGQWRQLTRFWVGDWYKENEVQNDNETVRSGDKVNSYLYNWSLKEIGHEDYILNKFGDEKHEGHADVLPTERIFIVKNAPIPCEYNYATLFIKRDKDGNPVKDESGNLIRVEVNEDPYPNLAKIVDKNYIDNRFNGIRIVNVDDTVGAVINYTPPTTTTEGATTIAEGNTNGNEVHSEDTSIHDYPIVFGDADTAFLRIRPYTCIYELTKPVKCIHIFDDLDCGNGKTTRSSLIPKIADGKDSKFESNFLTFYIKLPCPVVHDAAAIDKQGIVFLANNDIQERKVTEKNSAIDETATQNEGAYVTEKYSPSVKWSFLGERHRVIKQAWLASREVFIKCEAYYSKDGKLNILCTSAVSYDQGTSIPEYISGYACNDFRHHYTNRFASSNLLFLHTFVNPTEPDGSTNDDSILNDYWDETAEEKVTYADTVNKIHVSTADRTSWETHVNDVGKGSMYITNPDNEPESQHHFANGEKEEWLKDIYERYIGIKSKSKYVIVNDSGGTVDPKVAYIGLETIDEMSTKKPDDKSYIPTTNALYAHAFDWREGHKPDSVEYQPRHVTDKDIEKWNRAADNSANIGNIDAGHCINISANENNGKNISVRTVDSADAIKTATEDTMANTVPTTGAVKAYAAGAGGIQYDDKEEGETEAPISSNFRFLGPYVHRVVEYVEGKPLVKLYFGPNNNPSDIKKLQLPTTGSTMYLYSACSASEKYKDRYGNYNLPNGVTAGSTYSYLWGTKDSIANIQIKGDNTNNKNYTDYDFIIPVKLPRNTTSTEENASCIKVKLIHKSPSGTPQSAQSTPREVSCSIPIKINSSSGKYECDTTNTFTEIKSIQKTGKTYTITSQVKDGLQLKLTNVIINQQEDAEAGLLPDVVRAQGSVSINTSGTDEDDALDFVGVYELQITTANGTAKCDKEIFIYKELDNPSNFEFEEDEPKPTATVSFVSGGTKTVSGIKYNDGGKIKVTVENIKYTQPQVTPNKKRVELTWGILSDSNINITKFESTTTKESTSTLAQSDLTAQNSAMTNAVCSEFTYDSNDKHTVSSEYDVAEIKTTLESMEFYGQSGELWNTNISSITVTDDNYVWTHEHGTASENIITFNDDNDTVGTKTYYRYLNAFDPKTTKFLLPQDNPTDTKYKYDSTKRLNSAEDYKKELLVQGGWLKHPKHDRTGNYSTVSDETRCYVREVKFPGTAGDQIGEFTVTIDNVSSTDGFSMEYEKPANVNLYLAKPKYNKLLHLNGYFDNVLNRTNNIIRAAKIFPKATDKTIDGHDAAGLTWTCKVYDPEEWDIRKGDIFYLIVTMNSSVDKIGSITLNAE